MKMKLSVAMLMVAAATPFAGKQFTPAISGAYLAVRSWGVYAGPCFANGEMGHGGKEGMLIWSVREGSWNGVMLDGLNVIAVVRTDGTLGDLRYQPRSGKAVFVVDMMA